MNNRGIYPVGRSPSALHAAGQGYNRNVGAAYVPSTSVALPPPALWERPGEDLPFVSTSG